MLREDITVVTCEYARHLSKVPSSSKGRKGWDDLTDPRSTFDSWLESLTSDMYTLIVSPFSVPELADIVE
jgi:hypothetical protein